MSTYHMKRRKSAPRQRSSIPVVVLCGGKGSRLREETEFRPKPMISIGGKPILWHIMKIYAHWGFNKFVIALGYKGEQIKEYFLHQHHLSSDFTPQMPTGKKVLHTNNVREKVDHYRIIFAETGLETLHGERVLLCKPYIRTSRFMVTYGDGVIDLNLREVLAFHKKMGVIGTITGVHPRSKWGLVKTDAKGFATRFRQKPVLDEYVNGGFMVFEREFFSYLRLGEWIESGLERLVEKRQLAVYPHDGFWYAMDTYQDMEALQEMWKRNPKWKVWED